MLYAGGCVCVRGAPLQDRHALHVLLHAIEEVVHVSFVRQAEAPALALQVPLVGLGAQHHHVSRPHGIIYSLLDQPLVQSSCIVSIFGL